MQSDRTRPIAGPLALVAALTVALFPGSALAKPKPKPVITGITIVKQTDRPSSLL